MRVPVHMRSVLALVLLAAALSACSSDRASGPPVANRFWSSAAAPSMFVTSGGAYDASVGTLPDAQGWSFENLIPTNPLPFVAGGVLYQGPPVVEAQDWWQATTGIDFMQDYVAEAVLRIVSSNHIPSTPTSRSWEGYYIFQGDASGRSFELGLADNGYTVNALSQPGQPFFTYPIADGRFHTFRIVIHAGTGTLFIDGTNVASTTSFPTYAANGIVFGAASYTGKSISELKSLCYGSNPTDCLTDLALAAVPPLPTFRLNRNAVVTFADKNLGPRPSTSAVVFIPSNPAFRFISASGATCGPVTGGLSCALGSVAAGGQLNVSLTVRPILRGTFPVTMTLSGQETDGNVTNNVFAKNVTVH